MQAVGKEAVDAIPPEEAGIARRGPSWPARHYLDKWGGMISLREGGQILLNYGSNSGAEWQFKPSSSLAAHN